MRLSCRPLLKGLACVFLCADRKNRGLMITDKAADQGPQNYFIYTYGVFIAQNAAKWCSQGCQKSTQQVLSVCLQSQVTTVPFCLISVTKTQWRADVPDLKTVIAGNPNGRSPPHVRERLSGVLPHLCVLIQGMVLDNDAKVPALCSDVMVKTQLQV